MTTDLIKSLLVGQSIQINNKFISFGYGGKLTITSTDEPIYGQYEIFLRENCYYLKSDPPIINDINEMPISILLGNCESGILINSFK